MGVLERIAEIESEVIRENEFKKMLTVTVNSSIGLQFADGEIN